MTNSFNSNEVLNKAKVERQLSDYVCRRSSGLYVPLQPNSWQQPEDRPVLYLDKSNNPIACFVPGTHAKTDVPLSPFDVWVVYMNHGGARRMHLPDVNPVVPHTFDEVVEYQRRRSSGMKQVMAHHSACVRAPIPRKEKCRASGRPMD